jgi:hypothetical protein
MTKYDDVNTPVIAAIGFLAIAGLVAFVLFLEVLYYRDAARQEDEKVIAQPTVEVLNLKTEQQGRLANYAWADHKIKAIPIDRAMDLVLAELARGGKEAKRGK